MFLDDEYRPTHRGGMASPPASAPSSPRAQFDDLDDVFGSAPSSPSLLPSDPDVTTAHSHRPQVEPSEIPRLRSAHSTAGYRDGVAAAKGTQIQAGFDEGYTLGAVVGLKVGRILGTLEGIYGAVLRKSKSGGRVSEGEIQRLKELVVRSRGELRTEEVFGSQYWGSDGIWKFEVEEERDGDVVFGHVAAAHPGLKRWEAIVCEEVEKHGLVVGRLAGEEGSIED